MQKKENGFITCPPIALVDRLCYKIIDSSVPQELFSSLLQYLSYNGEKNKNKIKRMDSTVASATPNSYYGVC